VAWIFSNTGKDLFLCDHSDVRKCLLYNMATSEEFLYPLSLFKDRRLYANLVSDSVVPLGTGAFISRQLVKSLRSLCTYKTGIVSFIRTKEIFRSDTLTEDASRDKIKNETSKDTNIVKNECETITMNINGQDVSLPVHDANPSENLHYLREMSIGLVSCGWDKVVVYFHCSVLPLAHNKICALSSGKRYPQFATFALNFHEGRSVMIDACNWLQD